MQTLRMSLQAVMISLQWINSRNLALQSRCATLYSLGTAQESPFTVPALHHSNYLEGNKN